MTLKKFFIAMLMSATIFFGGKIYNHSLKIL